MRLVHTTGKTWYKVLHKHTMYVISLSNISIKTNFKQITRVEIKLLNLYTTLRETTFCAWRHVICALLTLLTLTCFTPHSNEMRSWQTSRHSFITTVWWYNILYQTGSFLYIQRKTYKMLNKTYYLNYQLIRKSDYQC